MKVLITGVRGQLGHEVFDQLKTDHEPVGIDIEDVDIADFGAVDHFIKTLRPGAVVNCAAYTNVDKCEEDEITAYRANAVGPQNIAVACGKYDAKMVHISTDFVFDGTADMPYTEFDPPNPLSIYGKSKLAGEVLVRDIIPKHFIVRTAWLYGENGHNFVKTMLKLAEERRTVRVVDDQHGTPTYAPDLAKTICGLLKTEHYGTYHCSNNGSCTWHGFATKIFELTGSDTKVEKITSAEFNRPAKRPKYSVMRNLMLEMTIGDHMPDWEDGLDRFIQAIK